MDFPGEILGRIDAGDRFAAAVVVSSSGSTPQRPGARALIDAAGAIKGTVGGGIVEAACTRRALELLRSLDPVAALLDLRLENRDAGREGAICGGRMRILVDPCPGLRRDAYAAAAAALSREERGLLLHECVPVTNGFGLSLRWVADGDRIPGLGAAVRAELDACRADGLARLATRPAEACPGGSWAFLEPVRPAPRVVIVGGGHVGRAVAHAAAPAGFAVTVIDDRPEFCRPEDFPPGTTVCCGEFREILPTAKITRDTYVVIVTRGHTGDAEALAACIHSSAAYIGMIGSRRKVRLLRERFVATGAADGAELDRVYAPIGAEIGAVTVPEIAVSIVAELIAVRRGALRHPSERGRERP